MKICDLTQWYTAASGGIRTYIDARRRYILERSDDQHVLITPGEHDATSSGERWSTYTIAAPSLPGCRPYRYLWRFDKVLAILERERPDLIELGSPYLLQGVAAAHRRRHPCALVGFYHTDFPEAYVRRPVAAQTTERLGRLAGRGAESCARTIYRVCDLAVAASPRLIEKLRSLGLNRTLLVDLGVDTETFRPERRDRGLWSSLGLDPALPVLIYCGRLDSEKRVDLLLESFRRLAGIDASLVVMGEGELRRELERRAAGDRRVRILPFEQERERLAVHLASADLYVTAGPHETFALSVLEAQACGLPVVGVRAGALVERVPAGLGHLAAVDDPADLAACIARCLGDDLGALRARARAWVETRYAWDRCFGRQHANYAALVAALGAAPRPVPGARRAAWTRRLGHLALPSR